MKAVETTYTPASAESVAEKLVGRILIVDDEERMTESLCSLLAREGHVVSGALSAADAISQLDRERFDLVITDLRLPGQSGLEVLKAARHSDPERPVIIMTAYASVEAAVSAIGEGAYDFILKPIDHHELYLTIQRALDRRHLEQATRQLVVDLQRSNDVLTRRLAELNTLHEVSAALSSTAELPKLFQSILQLATGVVGADHGSVMLVDHERGALTVAAAYGKGGRQFENTQLPLGESIAGWAAAHGEPLLIEDVESDPRFARRNRPQFEKKSLVCAPLKTPSGVLGVICLADPREAEAFGPDDLRLLMTVAAQAAMAIEDSRHFQQVNRQLRETTALHELSGRLTEIERTDQMVLAVFACLDQLITCETLQWWQWDAGTQSLRLYADTTQSQLSPTSDATSAPIAAGDIGDENLRVAAIRKAMSNLDIVSGEMLTTAVRSADQPLGVFVIIRRHEKPFSESERSLVRLIGGQAERIFDRQRALLNASRLVTMGKMISEISHDLRKPLTNIRGSLQVLGGRLQSDPHTGSILKSTEEEVIRLAALVTELVDFSNPTRYRTERRDMRPMIFRAVGLIEQAAKKHDIEVAVRIPSVLKPIFCDENQITEALLNVLMNAIDAMNKGGTLTVTATAEPSFPSGEEQIQIVISDTGSGMSSAELARCFERYYTTKTTGTGLGLAIVQRIVQAHDGTVMAESTPGKCTQFILRFPVR